MGRRDISPVKWIVLGSLAVLLWKGEAPPRPYLETEIWTRTLEDTTWSLRKSIAPGPEGIVRDELMGPCLVRARWRWDLWKTFQEPGATTFTPPRQTLYGTWSPTYLVRNEEAPKPGFLRVK